MLEYVKENGAPVQKINIFFADLAEREELRKRLDAMDDVVVTSSLWNNLEINHANATKGNALLLDDSRNIELFSELAAGTHAAGSVGTLAENS